MESISPATAATAEILPPFAAEEKDDDLPAFLTQPLPAAGAPGAVKQPSGAKTALITGGAHRRGKEIAHALAARGYNVIIHCHTAVAEATHLVEELRQTYHVKTAYFRADFNSFDETADLLDSVSRTYGPVDLLVCQAGAFSPEETAAAISEAELSETSASDASLPDGNRESLSESEKTADGNDGTRLAG